MERVNVSPETVQLLGGRFGDFYDGVVSSVVLDMRAQLRRCEVIVQTQDRLSESGWSQVEFYFADVVEYRFSVVRTTFEVLSDGIQFRWHDGLVCVVFDANIDDSEPWPDAGNTAYVAARSCEVSIVPLPSDTLR